MIADLLTRVKALFAPELPTGNAGAVDLTEEGARLAGWLPYSAYRQEDQVFINRDSLGFVLEVTPQTGANQDTADRLKGLYARLPTDATMQIHLWASPNVRPLLREYAELRQADPDALAQAELRGGRPARNSNVHRTMARRRFAHLLRGAREPLANDVAFLVRDFQIFISVTLPGHIRDLQRLEQLLDIRDGMRSTLLAAQFPSRIVDASRLIELVGEWLNPARLRGTRKDTVGYSDHKSLAEQIIDRDTSADWGDPTKVVIERLGGSDDERVELRLLSVQRTPKTFALWGMSALVGDMYQDSRSCPVPSW